jgi:quercetin dioxygenase-like cupin family protein
MISKENSEQYSWGDNCLGWHLVKNANLSVIQEVMPPGTEEVKHKHLKAQQFFYILKGEATFEYEGKSEIIKAGTGIQFLPGVFHKIKNEAQEALEFLLVSQPPAQGDRVY